MTGPYGAETDRESLRAAIRNGEVPVAVYGLGKMGLPLAAVFADVTGNVIGADIDESVVESIGRGECHVGGEPGLPELVAQTVADGSLETVADPTVAADRAAVHVVIVPTLLTAGRRPDLSAVEAVIDDVATGLDPGDLVCIESTVPPRTCVDEVVPRLAERSAVDEGSFGVAFCPERTASGRALRDIREAYPKVVGGVDADSTRAAAALYDEVTRNEVIEVSDATTAEAMKVFSGVYRDVNIALANEFARYADDLGIDVREAIDAANSQPLANVLSPGPGVGGHCIPVYPHFLIDHFETSSPLIRIARAVNDGMPSFTVERVRDALYDAGVPVEEATVLVLGATYRPGVKELRNSPSDRIAELFSRYGASVYWSDPLIDDPDAIPGERLPLADVADADPDAIVVATPHEPFVELDWSAIPPTIVVDCHDALDLADTHHVEYTIGSPIGGPAGRRRIDAA
ncbi:nucleotide sugar dehydrogenase [Halorubrum sp. JWXQ-INN 858]|uniref:nucleotide sugar dehydrogenase n=1 Tax=Halorubrum sp. JWXQ-INN 858 TaxID=2690782 RepID=UPI00135B3239|nr:nucleotide sugar dehydrogenase [Halorubrum sp. JWXQ-INN 858]MWV65480.1 nucleotide sugar dehydrogenase [Halorubrum sp. JWXQ-INN 858]